MQETDDGSHDGATSTGTGASKRVLEDPDRLEIVRDGKLLAILTGYQGSEDFCRDGLFWRRHKYKSLDWSPHTTMLSLAGHSIGLMLYPYILLGALTRVVFDPRPGLDDVELAEILENPKGLSPLELFSVVR